MRPRARHGRLRQPRPWYLSSQGVQARERTCQLDSSTIRFFVREKEKLSGTFPHVGETAGVSRLSSIVTGRRTPYSPRRPPEECSRTFRIFSVLHSFFDLCSPSFTPSPSPPRLFPPNVQGVDRAALLELPAARSVTSPPPSLDVYTRVRSVLCTYLFLLVPVLLP